MRVPDACVRARSRGTGTATRWMTTTLSRRASGMRCAATQASRRCSIASMRSWLRTVPFMLQHFAPLWRGGTPGCGCRSARCCSPAQLWLLLLRPVHDGRCLRAACQQWLLVSFCCPLQHALSCAPHCPDVPAAAMVGDSWLGRHFEVIGDRSTHYGLFACGPAPAPAAAAATSAGGACC